MRIDLAGARKRFAAAMTAGLCALLASCTAGSGSIAPAAGRSDERPNIVILFVDDLGWLDVGFRSPVYDTPHIDLLRAQGASFERAYAPAPVCSPSRVGLITGQHPARWDFYRHVGAGNPDAFDKFHRTEQEFHYLDTDPAQMPSRNWLPLEAVTIAERLQQVGYATAFVGKWHIGHEPFHPIHQGFDEQHGVTNYGNPRSYYPDFFRNSEVYEDAPKDQFLTQRITQDGVDVIERLAGGDRPFFLNLWWYAVHKPIVGRKDLIAKYEARGLGGEKAEYASMIEAVDQSVGALMAALERSGAAANTIVVFTSDQGSFFDSPPLKGRKGDGLALFEGGARVPLLVRWPGHVAPGASFAHPVSLLDVAPSVLQPAGASLAELEGHDLIARLSNPAKAVPPVIMYRHYEDRYAAVVDGDWKLIATVSGDHELYNVIEDVSEAHDRAHEQPDRVARMLGVLEQWKVRYGIRRF